MTGRRNGGPRPTPRTPATRRDLATLTAMLLLAGSLGLAGCLGGSSDGNVALIQTGSSTVLPLAIRWAEEVADVDVSVSGGGSSHGLNAILTGEAHLGDASRTIKASDYEKVGCTVTEDQIHDAQTGAHPWTYPACDGRTPTEWIVAYDVLTVVVHPENDWARELNYTQLRAIFTTEGTATSWDEVPGLADVAPHEEIVIHAPDEASGTYEFFFEEIAGDPGVSLLAAGDERYSPSADDNVILDAVSKNPHAVGFFGFSYYVENTDLVTGVAIAQGDEAPVRPSFDTVEDYPITRPLHVYTDGVPQTDDGVSGGLRAYLQYALGDGQSAVRDVGYVRIADVNAGLAQEQRTALG